MDLQRIVQSLCEELPAAIGAVVCDFDGETVVSALGPSAPPAEAEQLARALFPRSLAVEMSWEEFLLRIAGAEPCALLRLFDERARARGGGALAGLDLRFLDVDLIVRRLPEDYYVMLALRRPDFFGAACRNLEKAQTALSRLIC